MSVILHIDSKRDRGNFYPEVPVIEDEYLRFWVESNDEAVCNDGSPADYVVKRHHSSSQWIVALQGGATCHDDETCTARQTQDASLTGSGSEWHSILANGLLSSDCDVNPRFCNSNTYLCISARGCRSGRDCGASGT